MRDSQKSKVYACDRALREWAEANKTLVRFPTKWEIGQFVGNVHAWAVAVRGRVPYYQAHTPEALVRRGGTRSLANQWCWRIRILRNDSNMNVVIVLHELAHLYAKSGCKHGPSFAATYLLLVTRFMGKEAGVKLRDLFRENRVKSREVTKRRRAPITDEQRAVLRERLVKARAAKLMKVA